MKFSTGLNLKPDNQSTSPTKFHRYKMDCQSFVSITYSATNTFSRELKSAHCAKKIACGKKPDF